MNKTLDLNRTVFELIKENPELKEILKGLGFTEIAKAPILHSVGKIMTIPKGAKMKNISMEKIKEAFLANGFAISGIDGADAGKEEPVPEVSRERLATVSANERTEKLKSYLRRLSGGEELETVRADFVREFGDVEASEIMQAEQELIKEGTPLEEVQQLCDVHSALFHGATREERIANAEKEVEASLARQAAFPKGGYDDKAEKAAALEAIEGHPLQTLTRENEALSLLLAGIKEPLAEKGDVSAILAKIREVSIHYAKKGDLLYPLLKVRYTVSGPSDVMWTVDDEIRDELGALEKETDRGEWWSSRLAAVLTRAEEMIYKEQNILFPICAVNFTEEEWMGIYHDAKDYADCFGVTRVVWEKAEARADAPAAGREAAPEQAGEIVMPGGHMTLEQLTALLNTIPLEISFVDADDINRFFNEGPKVFKRPGMAIDREVFSCHPPKIEPMVRGIIADFRAGKRDEVPVWMEKNGRVMLVKYMAVRDREKNYIGTVELVQDMEFAKEYFANH